DGVGTAFHVFGSHTYGEEGAAATVQVTIKDVDGAVSNTTSYALTVADAPVTATATPGTSVVEGAAFSGEGATVVGAHPIAPLDDFPLANVTITWGDGTTTHPTSITQPNGVGTAFHVFGTHTYVDGPASLPLKVTVNDGGGAVSNTTSYTVNVANALPV